MRLFLIRHGETEHNVAGLLAGVSDSRLTNHGVSQTQRLASFLINKRSLRFTQIFASDLQRASRTAKAISEAQNITLPEAPLDPICLPLLREQDFGSFELLPWNRSDDTRQNDPKPEDLGFIPKETGEAMTARATTFLDDYLLPLLALDEEIETCVTVVSHGLFLGTLWRTLLGYFPTPRISLAPGVSPPGPSRPLEYLPSWTNTGILELEIRDLSTATPFTTDKVSISDSPAMLPRVNCSLKVIAVNSKEHLVNLKRTKGGLGSSASDDKQKSLENFFKKPKVQN